MKRLDAHAVATKHAGLIIIADGVGGPLLRQSRQLLLADLDTARVPKIAILLRKVYGGAALGMGILPGFGTDLIYAWPSTEIGPMGAEQAVALFYDKDIKASKNPEKFRAAKIEEYTQQYADSLSLASDVTYVQDIIEPQETRRCITRSLRLLANKRLRRDRKHHGNIPL